MTAREPIEVRQLRQLAEEFAAKGAKHGRLGVVIWHDEGPVFSQDAGSLAVRRFQELASEGAHLLTTLPADYLSPTWAPRFWPKKQRWLNLLVHLFDLNVDPASTDPIREEALSGACATIDDVFEQSISAIKLILQVPAPGAAAQAAPSKQTLVKLTIDMATKMAGLGGPEFALSEQECRLIQVLHGSAGRVVDRRVTLQELVCEENSLDKAVSRLRKNIRRQVALLGSGGGAEAFLDLVTTHKGRGHQLGVPVDRIVIT